MYIYEFAIIIIFIILFLRIQYLEHEEYVNNSKSQSNLF